jgi:uncharacterized surface protein with fasciclin (FAS1) repeats
MRFVKTLSALFVAGTVGLLFSLLALAGTENPEHSIAQSNESVESPQPESNPETPASQLQGDTIADIAANSSSFKTLTVALEAAGLLDTLASQGPLTVFAPTDEAFAALPEGTLEELLKPENKEALVQILTYHVIPGAMPSSAIQSGSVKTASGKSVALKVDSDRRKVTVNDATVIQADLKASNGVIHVIDKVILPPR